MKNITNTHLAKLRQLSNNLESLKIGNNSKILSSYTYKITTKELISIYQNIQNIKPKEHKSYWNQPNSNTPWYPSIRLINYIENWENTVEPLFRNHKWRLFVFLFQK